MCMQLFPDLASLIKRGIFGVVAAELAVAGGAFLGFSYLRRSENSRKYLYQNYPSVVNVYYWAEDSISFGQLVGTRLRLSDVRRWTQIEDKMVSKLQVQQWILCTSAVASLVSYYVYDTYQKSLPSPDIPVQAWDKYVAQQKSADRDI